jgi:hypothetical protein
MPCPEGERTAPAPTPRWRSSTADPRYAWLNQTFFVGEGRMLPGLIVEYRVYRVP